MDFMDDGCAALVRYSLTPVIDTQAAYGAGQFSRPQVWAEPDLLHASRLMRRLADDRVYCAMLGTAGQARAQSRRDAFFTAGVGVDVLSNAYGSAAHAPVRAGR
jgi:hypothetical protein